ncbi:hypothetical protein C8A05DRAFT_16120 [Staphylotrichum tortipilum]|uniref:RRM domain-containing protein n=1 Tax=Staphylotrichum tortipilum TaxID=2831512 RepID=A0AAN6MJJ4_9PEZI|nr:hypothetical protein C8A05DRAFT_16120 [Staphylotrichum longicolle]
MHRNQHHSQNLITFTVGPGSETGLYYILVANLAHKTTRRDLKAFAAQACEVDHAEVYPPTSGFVRVRGRANFEVAFKHLDGNTLEYRALQADARNMNQCTVVKLLATDYHAARILRGDTSRVIDELEAPTPGKEQAEPYSQGATAAGMGSPYPEYAGGGSPSYIMTLPAESQWGYAMASTYATRDGYQPAAAASPTLTPPGPMVYQVATATGRDFIQPVATSPHLVIPQTAAYQTVTSPTTPSIQQYHYSSSLACFSPAPAYKTTAYTTAPARGNSHSYAAGYSAGWGPDSSQASMYGSADRPAVAIEQRKIIMLHLEREGLSESVVAALLSEHAGIGGGTPGEVERIELPMNKDGRARGTALVTFSSAALAAAAVAALDGREAGAGTGKRLEARLAEGVSPAEVGGGNGGGRSGRRGGGKGGGAGKAGRGGSGQEKKREEPPVIVDGSEGRLMKKEVAPLVVDGSGRKKGVGGGRGGSRC